MRIDAQTSRQPRSPPQVRSPHGSGALSPGQQRIANGKATNGQGHGRAESTGSLSPTHTNGHSSMAPVRSMQTDFFGHDREEVTRILIQSLTDLGYHGAAGMLCQESGYELEGPAVAAFRSAVLQGDWVEAEALLFGTGDYEDGGGVGITDGYDGAGQRQRGLTLAEGANKHEMKFWMRQQKYLELLEARDLGAALMVLRQELTPLHQDVGRLHALSSLMMCQSAEDLKYQSQWDGASGESRNHLLSELSKSISPSIMIPEHRLAVLLDQVKDGWISNCLYHNTAASPSLYIDHACERDEFPLKTIAELRNHEDEVWSIQYSHDGSRLATSSKDHSIIIYDTTTYKPIHTLREHDQGVGYVTWSPDDTKLLSCSPDNTARMWDTRTGHCIVTLPNFTYPVAAVSWSPDGQSFVTGSHDPGAAIGVYNLEGRQLHLWAEENLRVMDLALSPDGQRLVVMLETRIQIYDFPSRQKICEYAVDDLINAPMSNGADVKPSLTSVAISKDSRRMLVSMNQSKLRLMDVDTGDILQNFYGHRQKEFIIRSAFGGADENFVVSGSEDGRIYIWRTNGALVEALDAVEGMEVGKPGCVNAVAWHPHNPAMFASAGDDRKVRIWAKESHPGLKASSSSNALGR